MTGGNTGKGYSGIYACHKYWGKKPPEAIGKILEVFGSEHCKVLDPFLGAGIVASLSSQMGYRFFGCDLNPVAVSISNIFLSPPSAISVQSVLHRTAERCRDAINATYQGHDGAVASHLVWDGDDIVEAWTKRNGRTFLVDSGVENWRENGRHGSRNLRYLSDRKLARNGRIGVSDNQRVSDLFSPRARENIDRLIGAIRQLSPEDQEIAYFVLTSALGQMSKMVFALNRRRNRGKNGKSRFEVGSWIIGYWLPRRHFEVNCWNVFEGRARKLANACERNESRLLPANLPEKVNGNAVIRCADAFEYMATFGDGSIDLIVTDPPHNDRVPYLELSEMWNTVLDKSADFSKEWVTSDSARRGKTTAAYMAQMRDFFLEAGRIVKGTGCLVFMFNCRDPEVWSTIREVSGTSGAFRYKGRFPLRYSANSLVQDTRRGALREDWCLVFGKERFVLPDNMPGEFAGWTEQWM